MKPSKKLPLAMSLILATQMCTISKAQSQSKAPASHIEFLNMKNPETIAMLDKQFISRDDENSIQQGIRLLALSIEAWNPSMKVYNSRQRLIGFVQEQGILNGLIAPSVLLIDHALRQNKVEFAASLAAMVRHISPQFYANILIKDNFLLLNTKNFRSIASGTDLEISKNLNSYLGADFVAYSQQYSKTEFAIQKKSHQTSFVSKWQITNSSQELMSATVNSKNTPEGLAAAVSARCNIRSLRKSTAPIEETHFDFENPAIKTAWNLKSKVDNSNPFSQKYPARNRCDELKNIRINPKLSAQEYLKEFTVQQEMTPEWVTTADCYAVETSSDPNSNDFSDAIENKIREERAKYSDGSSTPPPQYGCIGTCVNSINDWSQKLAGTFGTAGLFIGGPKGFISGAVIGVMSGAVVGAIDCQSSKQCGGDPVQNAQQAAELKKVIDEGRIREEKLKEAESKRRQAESEERVQKMKEEQATREKNEREQKQREARELENQRLTEKFTPDKSKARTGADSCNGNGCPTSNIVDGGSPEFRLLLNEKKARERAERIREFYERKQRDIHVDPDYQLKKMLAEAEKAEEEYRRCLEKDSLRNYGPDGYQWREPFEEQVKNNAEKARLERESRTTPVPKEPWSLFQQ